MLEFWFLVRQLMISPLLVFRCRKSDAAVDMDEMMAAMVLTSLSCSPVVQSPPNSDASMPGNLRGAARTLQPEVPRNACWPAECKAP